MEEKLNKEDFAKLSEEELLILVAHRLKDRNLFPKQVEEAKEYLKSAIMIR